MSEELTVTAQALLAEARQLSIDNMELRLQLRAALSKIDELKWALAAIAEDKRPKDDDSEEKPTDEESSKE